MRKMGKRKKERLEFDYGEITQKEQEAQMDELFRIQELFANGNIPDVSELEKTVSNPAPITTDLDFSLDDAMKRLTAKNTVAKFKPVKAQNTITEPSKVKKPHAVSHQKITSDLLDNEADGLDLDFSINAVEQEIRSVKVRKKPDETSVPVQESKPEPIVEETPQIDDSKNDSYADNDEMTLNDIAIVFYNEEDGVLTVHNPLSEDEGVSMNLFCLKDCDAVRDENYRMLKDYVSTMLAVLSGPIAIIPYNSEPFRCVAKNALKNDFRSDNFIVFTGTSYDQKYFIVYVLDPASIALLNDVIIPVLEEDFEYIGFVSALIELVTNQFLNPLACDNSEWVEEFIDSSISDDEIITNLCDIIMREHYYEDMDATISDESMELFISEYSLGDISKFMSTIKALGDSLETQIKSFPLSLSNDKTQEVENPKDTEKITEDIELDVETSAKVKNDVTSSITSSASAGSVPQREIKEKVSDDSVFVYRDPESKTFGKNRFTIQTM